MMTDLPIPNTQESIEHIFGLIGAVNQARLDRLRESEFRATRAAVKLMEYYQSLDPSIQMDGEVFAGKFAQCGHPGCGVTIKANATRCAMHQMGHNRFQESQHEEGYDTCACGERKRKRAKHCRKCYEQQILKEKAK